MRWFAPHTLGIIRRAASSATTVIIVCRGYQRWVSWLPFAESLRLQPAHFVRDLRACITIYQIIASSLYSVQLQIAVIILVVSVIEYHNLLPGQAGPFAKLSR
ncbi:hypothetical protein PENSPDRAFT_652036 [Peniophora sp. CONT]|nr:hypothetical protein PENSPDRAFT_652036 [Peniophora sp. CONT]